VSGTTELETRCRTWQDLYEALCDAQQALQSACWLLDRRMPGWRKAWSIGDTAERVAAVLAQVERSCKDAQRGLKDSH